MWSKLNLWITFTTIKHIKYASLLFLSFSLTHAHARTHTHTHFMLLAQIDLHVSCLFVCIGVWVCVCVCVLLLCVWLCVDVGGFMQELRVVKRDTNRSLVYIYIYIYIVLILARLSMVWHRWRGTYIIYFIVLSNTIRYSKQINN